MTLRYQVVGESVSYDGSRDLSFRSICVCDEFVLYLCWCCPCYDLYAHIYHTVDCCMYIVWSYEFVFHFFICFNTITCDSLL